MKNFSQRERLMLEGLFLSKFDREGLKCLGFSNFAEAYNAMGYALGGKPTSIKNYMQEFDPHFPNPRQGWHKRPMRDHCRVAIERFGQLTLQEFYHLLSPLLITTEAPLPSGMEELAALNEDNLENESFSKRLITGIAAEKYFESSFRSLTQFFEHALDNVTKFGCGFDFRITPGEPSPFLAAEVKGLAAASGSITLTEKEHRVADFLRDRYFLCVVSNFKETPELSIFQNPLHSGLEFSRSRKSHTVTSWQTKISA